MPITPLHFGLLAPANHFFPGKVSNPAFVATNLLIDGNTILYYAFGLGHVDHGLMTHSFMGALAVGLLVAAFGFRSRSWILGAILGGLTRMRDKPRRSGRGRIARPA